jgi:phosphatidylserine/phosphatidylglycerophosphate/cardiolipin synthase-like enzyme
MELSDWFLRAHERGNRSTRIDERRAADDPSVAWTEGNEGRVLVDGAEYFSVLHRELCESRSGDWVYFTDWQGDPDEQLDDTEQSIGAVLCDLVSRGVEVRGLLWRSHPEAMNFGEAKNLAFSRVVNESGGEVLLDHRVRRGGSHHQKLFVIRRHEGDGTRDVAYVGGIDLCHGRRDDRRHRGDPQAVELDDSHYGEQPPWHDLQIELRGPVVEDLAWSFAERWCDPTPLDTRNPVRALLHRAARLPREASPLAPTVCPPPDGPLAVQVLRTYPQRRKEYPFAARGEQSIARAYLKAFARARRLVYLEDQYLWSTEAGKALAAALRRSPDLRVVIVIPRYPDPDGTIAGAASRIGRERVLDLLFAAGGDRVAVYDLENDEGTPIYVHSKVCIVDDVWIAVGSDNLNRRSWTHDSELSCAVIDSRRDERAPADLTGVGDGARVLARETRLRLACEHLGLEDADAAALVDPDEWLDAFRRAAAEGDRWHRDSERGPRPSGHVRVHPRDRVRGLRRIPLRAVHALFLDPDGRPLRLRRPHPRL